MNDIHALSGAYAVDALDDLERIRFERHLKDCDTCRAEVTGLRETAAVMATVVAVTPPAALRDRVLADIRTVRPLPPEVTPVEVVGQRARRFPRLVAAAAAALVLAGGVGLAVDRPWEEPGVQPVAAQVMEAGDAVSHTVKVDGGGSATVWHSRDLGKAVLITEDVPDAPDGKVYEMWLQDDEGAMVPAGLMTGGDATVVLEGDASAATGVGITVEPEGGSEVPTSAPVALVDL
ncbi:anti-sigma factor [Alteromonas gracilis]